MKRIGVVGLGVGASHVEFAEANQAGSVLAVCDHSPEKVAAVRMRYPHVRAASDFESILRDESIDTIVVASFDQDHLAQVVASLDAGRDVFVEKPLCLTVEGCKQIRKALVRNAGRRLASNLIMRYYPRFDRIKRGLRAGEFGELFYLEGSYDYGRIEKITTGWRSETPDYSVMLGGGVHIVDLMLWLKEGAKVIEVTAFSAKSATRGTRFVPPDLTVALLRFSDGSLAKVSANFGCVRPHFHEFQWFGEKASGTHQQDGWLIHSSRDPQVAPLLERSEYPGVGKGRMLVDFLNAVSGGSVSNAEDSLACVSVCLAIDESARTGRNVNVEYL